MGERDDARSSIEEARDRMSEIAEELSRRASPQYIGKQAREATLDRANEWKERAFSNPRGLALMGAGIGALTGLAIGSSRSRESTHYGGFRQLGRYEPGKTAGMKAKTSEVKEQALERGTELKDQALEKGTELKEQAEAARHTAIEYADRAKRFAASSWDRQPLTVAVGAVLTGALIGLFAPVSRKERELLEPAKDKAKEGFQKVGDVVQEKLGVEQEPERPEQTAPAEMPSISTTPVTGEVPATTTPGASAPPTTTEEIRPDTVH